MLHAPALTILPGSLVVTFIVRVSGEATALVMRPSRFLEGLEAACSLLDFAELDRAEERLDDLLPWAGNV